MTRCRNAVRILVNYDYRVLRNRWRLQTVRCASLSSTYVSCLTTRHTLLNPYWLCVSRPSQTNLHVSQLLMNTWRCPIHTALLSWISGHVIHVFLIYNGSTISLSTPSSSKKKNSISKTYQLCYQELLRV